MKNLNSKRKYTIAWVEEGKAQAFDETLESILNEEEPAEFKYAIQDRIDAVLDLKVNESMFFQFDRDNENTIGAIQRIK